MVVLKVKTDDDRGRSLSMTDQWNRIGVEKTKSHWSGDASGYVAYKCYTSMIWRMNKIQWDLDSNCLMNGSLSDVYSVNLDPT